MTPVLRRAALAAFLLTATASCAGTRPGDWTAEQRAEMTRWSNSVSEKLRSKAYFPRDPTRVTPLPADAVLVRLSFNRAGEIYTPQIARSSGVPLFDSAALTAVLAASPLPTPPAFLFETASVYTVNAPIRFNDRPPSGLVP